MGYNSDTATEVIRRSLYYPFGMELGGLYNNTISFTLGTEYQYNGKEKMQHLYDYGARWYYPSIGRFIGVDPLASSYPGMSPYSAMNNNPILYIDPDGRAAVNANGGGSIDDLIKRATNFVVSRVKQAIYDFTVSLTKSTINYADRNYNPATIYNNITNPHSDLPEWQAESLAKYSDVAVSSDDFINSISGLSKNEAKRQEPGRGPLGSQSGGPTSRYVADPANSNRIIDMRHFLSIGDMGEAIGLGVEVMQSTKESWRPSAFDLQDYYSNDLGQQFYDSDFYQQYKSGDVEFSESLNNFFQNRANQ